MPKTNGEFTEEEQLELERWFNDFCSALEQRGSFSRENLADMMRVRVLPEPGRANPAAIDRVRTKYTIDHVMEDHSVEKVNKKILQYLTPKQAFRSQLEDDYTYDPTYQPDQDSHFRPVQTLNSKHIRENYAFLSELKELSAKNRLVITAAEKYKPGDECLIHTDSQGSVTVSEPLKEAAQKFRTDMRELQSETGLRPKEYEAFAGNMHNYYLAIKDAQARYLGREPEKTAGKREDGIFPADSKKERCMKELEHLLKELDKTGSRLTDTKAYKNMKAAVKETLEEWNRTSGWGMDVQSHMDKIAGYAQKYLDAKAALRSLKSTQIDRLGVANRLLDMQGTWDTLSFDKEMRDHIAGEIACGQAEGRSAGEYQEFLTNRSVRAEQIVQVQETEQFGDLMYGKSSAEMEKMEEMDRKSLLAQFETPGRQTAGPMA